MNRPAAAAFTALLVACAVSSARADQVAAPRGYFQKSPGRTRTLEVIPPRRYVDHPSGSRGTNPSAEAHPTHTRLILRDSTARVVWIALAERWSERALVADRGDYVATMVWAGGVDDAEALVLYGPSGQRVAALAPNQFASSEELKRFAYSVSHVRWGRAVRFDFERGHLVLHLTQRIQQPPFEDDPSPVERRIDLSTGAVVW